MYALPGEKGSSDVRACWIYDLWGGVFQILGVQEVLLGVLDGETMKPQMEPKNSFGKIP